MKYRYFFVDSKRDAEKVLRDLRRARETGALVVKPAKAAKDEPVPAKHLALADAIVVISLDGQVAFTLPGGFDVD